MYRGKVVELGTPEAVYGDPVHSYTKSLISAVPIADPDYKKTSKINMLKKPLEIKNGHLFLIISAYMRYIIKAASILILIVKLHRTLMSSLI